jgi:hypothetical protein
VPAAAHALDAVEDSALLLTVALTLGSPGTVALAPGAGPGYSWREDRDWTCHNAPSGSRRGPRPDLAPDPETARTVDELTERRLSSTPCST